MEQHFELMIGPRSEGSAFTSDEARRAAWEEHRHELKALDPVASADCWAAKQYGAPPQDDDDEDPDPDEVAAPWL